MPQGSEGRFDEVGGANAHPVFCREIVERHQRVSILDQTFDGIRELGLIHGDEGVERPNGLDSGLRLPDVMQRLLRVGLGTLRQPIQHIARFVHPATLVAGFRRQFRHRIPESHGAVADGQLQGVHASRSQVRRHLAPILTRFLQTRTHRQQVHATAVVYADHHEHAEFAGFPAQAIVDTIGPD